MEQRFGKDLTVGSIPRHLLTFSLPMLLTLISLWVVRVPLAWFLSQHTPLGARGIWIAMAAGFCVPGCVSYLYYLTGR